MSLPNVPDINPLITLKREEVFHMLLASIAMEEIGLSHVLNAEGEKIQRLLLSEDVCLDDMIRLNKSIERILRSIIKNQMLLQFKLEDVLSLEPTIGPEEDCHEE
ncbi:hypothetical protein [Paenibacillus elgii]|uniref:hypothetical protein n=1 Tax=Paenibacillus elgii TaxID=189691 RepID=UPI0013D7CADE|nr:hypothetical protein [Paenibacillus elgii]